MSPKGRKRTNKQKPFTLYTMTKQFIWIGVFAGSTIGSWLGALLSSGNWLSGWSVLGGTVGAFIGIWTGYKISKMI